MHSKQWNSDMDTEQKIIDALKNNDAALLRQLLENEDDKAISKIKGLNQYLRLHLLDLKYGRNIISEAVLSDGKFRKGKTTVLNLRAKSIISIKTLYAEEGRLTVRGIHYLESAGRQYRLYIEDQHGVTYDVRSLPYERADIKGASGETVVRCLQYIAEVPLRDKMRISFCVEMDGQKTVLHPSIDKYIGFDSELSHSFIVRQGFIITHSEDALIFSKENLINRARAESAVESEIRKTRGAEEAAAARNELKMKRHFSTSALQDRVAFVSVRADGRLLGNMEKVYDALDLPKIKYSKMKIQQFPDALAEATEIVTSSRIVVTDDYLSILRDNEKKPGQKYVQLWHATGSGKHFGQDGTTMFPPTDALYHKGYDLVTVSAEGIRDVYAGAFGIDISRVKAAGVPRTDDFFDEEYIGKVRDNIYTKHPELKDREIIIYTPTFRDLPERPRNTFVPELDFDRFSAVVGKGRMFVVCPHPVMTEPIVTGSYDNITEIRDVSSNDMMFISDLMVTDYSSTMFEYSLLRKPMVFFCYDYDTYDREFYLDFDRELPGRILRTQDELLDYLSEGAYAADSGYDEFYTKYMSACDGRSTERVTELIKQLYYDRR